MVDVLVIGSGGAGLVAAIAAKESGASVILAGKSFPTRSQTSMAQGGINAAMANVEADSVEAHIADTMKSAQGLGTEASVRKMCEEATEAILWLERIGVPFSRTKAGKISQRRLGGASGTRACYAQDYTGLKILHTLYDQVLKMGIETVNEHFLLNYIIDGEKDARYSSGATFLNIRTGEVVEIRAKSVIIATGGYGSLFHGFTTNSTASTGDGVAAALRAGARLCDMEFIQFHPTALKRSALLISESARGAGGYLLNAKKERFTDELAARDIVARAIADEIHSSGEVYLDIRHLGEAFIDHELPQERKLAIAYEEVDPVVDLIPIKPVAHYTMGGVDVDEESMSCIQGLFAVGEAANQKVHGANRLGGNSLLELIVFGRQAGKNAAAYAKRNDIFIADNAQIKQDTHYIKTLREAAVQIDFYEKRASLGKRFYSSAGIKRNAKALEELLQSVKEMQKELPLMGAKDKSLLYNTNLTEFLEFSNVLELSQSILLGAISRKESRGAHYREDAPARDDDVYGGHSLCWRENDRIFHAIEK